MWRVLVFLLVLSQGAFAKPAVEVLKAEFEKALNEVKSLQAEIRKKQAKLDASLRKVEKLMEAVSVSEDGKGAKVSSLHIEGKQRFVGYKELITFPTTGPGGNAIGAYGSDENSFDDGLRIDSNHNLALVIDEQSSGTGDFVVSKDSPTGVLFTVKNNGNVGIGTTNPRAKLDVSGGSNFKGGRHYFQDEENKELVRVGAAWGIPGIYSVHGDIVLGVETNQKAFIGKYGNFMTVYGDGNVDVTGDVKAKKITETSDERLKQNIQPLVSSLAKLAQLRGVSFKWKDEPQDNQIGLVAQEVEKILPEIVSTDSKGYKSIAYGKLTAVLLEAIKEQQQQIEELKGMIKP